jgi:hypothetical protein
MDLTETEPCAAVSSPSRVFLGGVVLLLGLAFAGEAFGTGFRMNVPIWPWIILFLGLAKVGESRASGRQCISRSGLWFLFLGAWGLVNEYRLFDVSYRRTWPILLVGAGVLMVLHSQSADENGSAEDGRQ